MPVPIPYIYVALFARRNNIYDNGQPAMSAECEKVFSSIKKLITPEENRLAEDIIETSECLKNWWGCRALAYKRAAQTG